MPPAPERHWPSLLPDWIADRYELGSILDATAQPVAAFDCDNTLIRGDIGEMVLAHLAADGFPNGGGDAFLSVADHPRSDALSRLCRRGDPRAPAALLAAYREVERHSRPDAYRMAALAAAGWREADFIAFVRPLLREALTAPEGSLLLPADAMAGPPWEGSLRPTPVLDLLKTLAAEGVRILVISASHDLIVKELLKILLPDVPVEVYGVRLEQDGTGLLSPRVAPPLTWGEGKAELVRQLGLTSRLALAVGDSDGDLPLLRQATLGLRVCCRAPTVRVEAMLRRRDERSPSQG